MTTYVTAVFLLVVGLTGLTASPAVAQTPCAADDFDFGTGDDVSEIEVGQSGQCPPTTPSDTPTIDYRYILTTEGQPPSQCWRVVGIAPGHPRYDTAQTYEDAHAAGEFIYGDLLPWVEAFMESYATGNPMTVDPADIVLECDAVDPELVAITAWRDQVVLPAPDGQLDPGTEVVTGMDTYLTIGAYQPDWDGDSDPRTVTWTGPIRIIAEAEHQVSWGDGAIGPSENGWYATNGRPWREHPPDSAPEPITHVYEDATDGDSTLTIDVDTRWVARWETLDGSDGGTIPFFRYSSSSVDLDVDEVQSVVIDQS